MVLNRAQILVVLLVLTTGTVVLIFAGKRQYTPPKQTPIPSTSAHQAQALAEPSPNDRRDYKDSLAKLDGRRANLALRYQRATSSVERADILSQARTSVTQAIYSEIFPAWYGTPWDFYGTTEVPQQGKIACGYFVSTILRDAGWRLQRARLAQQASENIILSLTTDSYIKRYRRVPIGNFVSEVKTWGPGIYVVGLDIHTGFIVNTGNEVYFIHSSYADPYMVVREKASDSKILAASNYRVLGNVTADDLFIEKWLLGKVVVTRTA